MLINPMLIKPNKIHTGMFSIPYHVPLGWRRFIYNSDNCVFEIMDNLELCSCGILEGFSGKHGISGISFHPHKELAAFVTEDGMVVSDFHGNSLWEYKAAVSALLFSCDGNEVWIAENCGSEKLFVSIVDTDSGMEKYSSTLNDPFSCSGLMLCHAPDSVLLEMVDGNGCAEVWALDDTNGILTYREIFSNNNIMPAFHPDGKRLLTLQDCATQSNIYSSYSWPETELITQQRYFTAYAWLFMGISENRNGSCQKRHRPPLFV